MESGIDRGNDNMITPEQWAQVEKDLQSQFKTVKLQCDEYKVTLSLGQVGKMKLGIRVYVNGWFKGEWISNESQAEEARRFLPIHYVYRYSAKEKKLYKQLGKKYMKKYNIDLGSRMEFRGFYWSSFNSMKRHFIKHNKSIELIEENADAGNQCNT